MKRFVFTMLGVLGTLPSASAQKPRDPEQEKVREENHRIEHAAERILKPGETERERFLKETSRIRGIDPASEVGKPEPIMIYDRMSGGGPEWTYEMARQQGLRELFERVAGRLQLPLDRISRDQFLSYAAVYLRPENSPPYRSPADEEDRAFRDLDRNRDGVLDLAEVTESLRSALATVDRNRNQLIEREEYGEYFRQRVDVAVQKMMQSRLEKEAKEAAKAGLPPPPPLAPPSSLPMPPAPSLTRSTGSREKSPALEAVRYGHLPAGLPEWFVSLDLDRDGQIGLYEWRYAEQALADFERLDDNQDGLITPEEWLRFSRLHPEEASRLAKLGSVSSSERDAQRSGKGADTGAVSLRMR